MHHPRHLDCQDPLRELEKNTQVRLRTADLVAKKILSPISLPDYCSQLTIQRLINTSYLTMVPEQRHFLCPVKEFYAGKQISLSVFP
jgi:hypothetical protein